MIHVPCSMKNGFTLLELTVVVSIIIILTLIFLANYRGGELEFSLLRSTQRLAQDLRNTQEMALAGQLAPFSFGEVFPKGGYGIYLQNNSNSYILFADCDGDKVYDESGAALSCAQASESTPWPEKIKDLFLEEKVRILNVSPASPVSIVFFPPDPTITIRPLASSTIITLSSDGKTRTVTINTSGLIEIE